MLTINVFDNDGFKIDLDDLSSGEKQRVSIFSKVYLDVTSPCIFIIDEPEISLSIEWQKEFLRYIYVSEKVALLIATTHSPFIFRNDYVDKVKMILSIIAQDYHVLKMIKNIKSMIVMVKKM